MSETLKKADEVGAEALDGLKRLATNGIEFVEAQAPEVCREIVMRGLALHYMCAAMSLVFLVASLVLLVKVGSPHIKVMSQNLPMKGDPDKFFGGLIVAIPIIACVCVSFIVLCSNIQSAVMIHVAPRIYIMEYLADLVK